MMDEFVIMRNQQDGCALLIEARKAIHQLLQVTPILSEGGFIENDESGAKRNARSKRGALLLTDGK